MLLVEDLRKTCELICEMLNVSGSFQVVGVCATEHSALEWLDEHPDGADLVVLDLVLREGSGFSMLARLAAKGNCDTVVFSDFASPAVANKCRRMGAVDAISKADTRNFRDFLQRYREKQGLPGHGATRTA